MRQRLIRKLTSSFRIVFPCLSVSVSNACLCVLLLLASVSHSFPLPPASAQTPLDELPGLAELKKGAYASALKLPGARLATNPSDIEAEKSLLRAYFETGRYTEAESAARKILLKTPDAGAVHYELAEVLVATGRYTEAVGE